VKLNKNNSSFQHLWSILEKVDSAFGAYKMLKTLPLSEEQMQEFPIGGAMSACMTLPLKRVWKKLGASALMNDWQMHLLFISEPQEADQAEMMMRTVSITHHTVYFAIQVFAIELFTM